MKALRFHEYGGPEVLRIEDAPMPEPGAGEVLVRVSGSGINPVDWKVREGEMKDQMPLEFPQTVGWEFSGTVERLGDGVEGFEVGDDVYGICHTGTCADYAVAKVGTFAKAPPTMDLPDAGGIPLAALTAWQGLFDQGGLGSGQKVLILAATGGVGTFAVQFAHWAGATVYATGSSNRLDTVRELGADYPIDYKAQKPEDIVQDCDLVLDLVGGDTAKSALTCLKPGGVLVSTVFSSLNDEAQKSEKTAKDFMMDPKPDQLTKIGELIGDLKVRPVIDAVVPFIRAVEAQKEVQEGHVMGKMVVDVRR